MNTLPHIFSFTETPIVILTKNGKEQTQRNCIFILESGLFINLFILNANPQILAFPSQVAFLMGITSSTLVGVGE